MLTSKISVILIFLFLTNILQSQVAQQWTANFTFHNPGWSYPYAISIDNSANVYVSGYSGGGSSVNKCFTAKFNSSGLLIWSKLEENSYGVSNCNSLDREENLIVTGGADYGSQRGILTIKYSNGGSILWAKVYPGTDYLVHDPVAMKTDIFNNIYICGMNQWAQNSYFEYFVLKYNSEGILQWFKTHRGAGNGSNIARSMDVDSLGNVYVTGFTTNLTGLEEITTIKYNSTGSELWVRNYNDSTGSINDGRAIALDHTGNIYISGYRIVNNNHYQVTIKYDPDGNRQWVNLFTGPSTPYKIMFDHLGNPIVLANPNIIKFNSAGQIIWANSVLSKNDGILDKDDNLYLSGYKYLDSLARFNAIKFSSNGNILWEITNYNSQLWASCNTGVRVDSLKNVYVVFPNVISQYDEEFTVIKYSQPIGINSISNLVPKEYCLFQNYPNPFNPATKIKFDIPAVTKNSTTQFTLSIYDIRGRQIAILDNETVKPGSYEVSWDASNFPSGVYFYKLTAGSFSETKRMVLLK